MSATNLSSPPTSSTQTAPPPSPASAAADGSSASAVDFWTRLGLTVVVLLGSAGVRSWQARRIDGALAAERRKPPIDLAAVPLELGTWKGEAIDLDPHIARTTGADQIVTRRYVDQSTGVALDLILLYGPAADVYLHAPEACYPAAGFAQAAGPDVRTIPADGAEIPFRAIVYTKGQGGQAVPQEVYYSWWYNGRWTPEAGTQKYFERIPSMYKVQIARRVFPTERRDVGNPSEAFLRQLLPVLDQRIKASRSAAAAGPLVNDFTRSARRLETIVFPGKVKRP